MTDHQEEMLALHAVRTLTPEEVRLLESESKYDARMRETLEEFEETAAEIARLLPEEAPPPEMRSQILSELKAHVRGNVTPFTVPLRILRSPFVAWAAAAAIAVAAVSQWNRNRQFDQTIAALSQSDAAAQKAAEKARADMQAVERRLADMTAKNSDLTAELKRVNAEFAVANMQVAMLRSVSGVKRYDEATSLVVWNQEKQEGLLKLENMPAVQPNKDYQLWIICKQCQHPVSAGVVKVNNQGVTTITFKPSNHIAQALKFAISIEEQGGVPEKPETSPIIFASR
jgi:anti-sigma-K factor RskA